MPLLPASSRPEAPLAPSCEHTLPSPVCGSGAGFSVSLSYALFLAVPRDPGSLDAAEAEGRWVMARKVPSSRLCHGRISGRGALDAWAGLGGARGLCLWAPTLMGPVGRPALLRHVGVLPSVAG